MKFTTKPASHSYRLGFRIVLACLLAGVVTAGGAGEAQAQDLTGDKQALVALYHATDGANWTNNEHWLTDEPLSKWQGITVIDGRVTDVVLYDNRLTGTIPPELGNLSGLASLDLSNNQLTGPIPPELGKLSDLTVLYLFSNQLTAIPSELGNLASLTWLDLSNNQPTGPIPSELGSLPILGSLALGRNRLTGPIPPILGNLSNLSNLALDDNRLTGAIPPELGNLSYLWRLDLGNNRLTGPIPSELANLSSLKGLFLYNNRLTGPIPSELGNLSSLESLSLSRNQLTGPIPSEVGNLSGLRDLGLSDNQLTGPIPPNLGNLVSLRALSLLDNRLSGAIPSELANLSSLWGLYLAGNRLSGAIPPELANLSNLGGLSLANNQLTGRIPPELGNLSSLMWLDLVGNRLMGLIPLELSNLTRLDGLYLDNNQLTGPIPPELGNLSSLRGLDLADNRLVGPTPPELGNLGGLWALSLANNRLTGPIPQSFTKLTLSHFYFHGNPGLSVLDDVAVWEWLDGIKELRGLDYSPSTPFVPVILSAAGRNGSFFTSELTLTNRGTVPARLTYTYTSHIGGGSGLAYDLLLSGEQKIVPNAIEYLRGEGVPIPGAGNRIGTLRVSLRGFSSSQVEVTVRTATPTPEGRASMAYSAVPVESGLDEAVYLCGLRQNQQDRSNVAFQNMGGSGAGAITLRTTVFSGNVDGSAARVLEDVTLSPGGFYQHSELLETAGFTQGYVKVERVSGTAPFYAYGVINDQVNSDGSFIAPIRESSLAGSAGQTLPVIVETGVFTSELVVTNFSDAPKTVTLRLKADAVGTPDKTAVVEWTFRPGQQVIVPNIVQMLRHMGTPGIGPSGQTFAGALFATVSGGDISGIAIGARTNSPGGSGQYGVFYNAVPYGDGFLESAWVEALQQNKKNRSNLALVNTGEVDASPSVFHLEIYDGETRELVNTVTGLRVAAGGWHQVNSILADYAPGTPQGYVRIMKISGNNPFLAYGVIHDGGAPGEQSGDGAYIPARE